MQTYYKFEIVGKSWCVEGYIKSESTHFFELYKAKKPTSNVYDYLDSGDSLLFLNKSEILCYYPTKPPKN